MAGSAAFGNSVTGMLDDGWQAWKRFWFTPRDPVVVSLMRWPLAGMILYTHLIWSLDFQAFFASTGSWQSRELVQRFQENQFAYSFWWYVPEAWLWPVHLLCLAVLTMFWVGLATPVTAWLAFVIVVSYANRVPLAMYGLDQINCLSALYLAIAPSGARYSVDAWLRHRWRRRRQSGASECQTCRSAAALPGPTVSAQLATRLFQVHLCYIYLWGGLGKLQGETWWSGEALWLAAASLDYQSNDLTWLIHFPWLYQLMTVGTWAWEITFPILVWMPRLRPWMLLVGASMHLGIGMFMGMWTFGLVMIFTYLAFLTPQQWTALLRWWGRSAPQAIQISAGHTGTSTEPAEDQRRFTADIQECG